MNNFWDPQQPMYPQYGMDSHSGIRHPGQLTRSASVQPTPQNVVPQVPQPTPTNVQSAYQREMQGGPPGAMGRSPAAQPQNGLAAILANLFGFMNGGQR